MFPSQITGKVSRTFGDTKTFGNGSIYTTVLTHLTHFTNDVLSQHASGNVGASGLTIPALHDHIGTVVSVSAKPKMVGTTAGRVITFMKYFHPTGNWAKNKFVHQSVSAILLSIVAHLAVSRCYESAGPNPAVAYYFDLTGKSAQQATATVNGSSASAGRVAACYARASGSSIVNSHDLNLRDRLGLWLGSFVATNNVRAVCILP